MRTIACETCTFWVAHSRDAPQGECHRRAPLVTGGLHCEISTEWPQTVRANWCGDHAFNRETA